MDTKRSTNRLYDGLEPSNCFKDTTYLLAINERKNGLKTTDQYGKIVLLVDKKYVDQLWFIVRNLTINNKLGEYSKSSIVRPNKEYITEVIVIYTYDKNDKEDVERITKTLLKSIPSFIKYNIQI